MNQQTNQPSQVDNSSSLPENDLVQVIEQSKQSLSENHAKKGRGRPRKSEASPITPKVESAPVTPQNFTPPPPVEFTSKVYGDLYAGFGRVLSRKTNFKGFELNADEKKALGDSTDVAMQVFYPEVMATKYGVLVMLAITVGGVFGPKYMDYMDALENQKKGGNVKEEKNSELSSEDKN